MLGVSYVPALVPHAVKHARAGTRNPESNGRQQLATLPASPLPIAMEEGEMSFGLLPGENEGRRRVKYSKGSIRRERRTRHPQAD